MKFKIGDKVRVTHASYLDTIWCPAMNEAIGKEYEVVRVYEGYYIYALSFLNGGCYFPEDSLELAKPQHVPCF